MNLPKIHPQSIWIGFDPREVDAYAVARSSIHRHTVAPIPVRPVALAPLRAAGLYRRPTEIRDGRLWDAISEAPMATEFACSRFLVPRLAGGGWALFMDCDMLIRTNLSRLFSLADPSKAVMVVKHHHEPPEGEKMDGQVQTRYARKNWSSVMLFNCDHPANQALTVDLVNEVPGRDLHRFCWLDDDLIGELPPSWNWLAFHSSTEIDPDIVHFTEGVPSMAGYEDQPFADEWRRELLAWAA
jgi:hypothetical protein